MDLRSRRRDARCRRSSSLVDAWARIFASFSERAKGAGLFLETGEWSETISVRGYPPSFAALHGVGIFAERQLGNFDERPQLRGCRSGPDSFDQAGVVRGFGRRPYVVSSPLVAAEGWQVLESAVPSGRSLPT